MGHAQDTAVHDIALSWSSDMERVVFFAWDIGVAFYTL